MGRVGAPMTGKRLFRQDKRGKGRAHSWTGRKNAGGASVTPLRRIFISKGSEQLSHPFLNSCSDASSKKCPFTMEDMVPCLNTASYQKARYVWIRMKMIKSHMRMP